MNIALDGSALSMTSGGLKRYTEELARALRQTGDCVKVLKPQGSLWWSVRLPLQLRDYDVFHGTNFEVPYLPVCPSVMTVHDVSPWMDASWHADAHRVRRRTPVLVRLGLATMLIVPTRAVQSQVISMFSVSEDRVAVVYEGARMQRVNASVSRPYFLFVGTIEPRKNVHALVDAWRPLRNRVDLVLAGRTRSDAQPVAPEPGLTVAGEVSEERLADLYSGAVALVYPSLYEGFGLPVVEAMQCGTPVITSQDPALREVAGGAAIHAESHQLTEAMRALIDDAAFRAQYAASALRRGAEFTWERTASATREVYGEAIARASTLA